MRIKKQKEADPCLYSLELLPFLVSTWEVKVKYIKVIGFVLTILVFYYFIIFYGVGALIFLFDKSSLFWVGVMILFILALTLWTKISFYLIKEMKFIFKNK